MTTAPAPAPNTNLQEPHSLSAPARPGVHDNSLVHVHLLYVGAFLHPVLKAYCGILGLGDLLRPR